MLVILLGYRGSGKTSVGRAVADRLGCGFVDLDDRVRRRFGERSVAEIWAREGEPRFREVEVEEARAAARGAGGGRGVLALGGGTLMQPEARHSIKTAEHAVRVYLRCGAAELTRRIAGDGDTAVQRPNLTRGGDAASEVVEVMRVRGPVYEAVADVVVDVEGRSVEEVVAEVVVRCERTMMNDHSEKA